MSEAPEFLRPVTAHAADKGQTVTFGPEQPLKLDCGKSLTPFTIAYMTYGTLNAAKSNAILVCHALTGDQFVASDHPVTGKPGWWTTMVGPGKPIDTDRFFVICANVIGGCMGTTGPASIDPTTGASPMACPFRWSPFATWCAPRRCWSSIWALQNCWRWWAARWAGCRRCNGRRLIPSGCAR